MIVAGRNRAVPQIIVVELHSFWLVKVAGHAR